MDSPPHAEARQHTPSSFPRTQVPVGASTTRVALEKLKQHMTFSDLDDVSVMLKVQHVVVFRS